MAGIFIFSDLHGSGAAAYGIAEALRRRGGAAALERVIFCGDAYQPCRAWEAARLLEELENNGNFTAVDGNCDNEPWEDGLRYTITPGYALVQSGGRALFVTHGDRWNPRRLPPAGLGDALIYGHTHLPDAQCLTESGMVVFSPGSCAQPRGGWPATYGWLENGTLAVCHLRNDRRLMEIALG